MHVAADTTPCLDPTSKNCYGGFARIAHVIKTYRALHNSQNGRQVLYLNAGDIYYGTTLFTIYHEKIAIEFLNELQPNVSTLGNHEFDLGPDGVVKLIQGTHFPIVVANVDFSKEPKLASLNIPSSVVLDVRGIKIGVIGYLTGQTKIICDVGKVVFSDEVVALRRESERLDDEGVKIIIALGHSGYAKDQLIAKHVPLVDLVVGGHSNTFLWNGEKPDLESIKGPYPTVVTQDSGKKVPVVQAYAHTKYLGILNVTFDEHGDLIDYQGNPVLLDSSIPEDPDMLSLLNKYATQTNERNAIVVGKSRVKLDSTEHNCRHQECNIGNFVADAFVAYHAFNFSGSYWTDAPIALLYAGIFRGNIDKVHSGGEVTLGDLERVMPFSLHVGNKDFSGAKLMVLLESSLRIEAESLRKNFLQVSGLRLVYDLSRPFGQRVVDVKVLCNRCEIPVYENLDLKKNYRVIIDSYIAKGSSSFEFLNRPATVWFMYDKLDVEIVAWYMQKMSPVAPRLEGRISIINDGHVVESAVNQIRVNFNLVTVIVVSILIMYFL